jgi:hypothetical protein
MNSPYSNSHNIYDPHGALQGVLAVLGIHASAITLQERVRIAMELVAALTVSFETPERPQEDTQDGTPRLTTREQWALNRQSRPPVEPRATLRRDPSESGYSQYYD